MHSQIVLKVLLPVLFIAIFTGCDKKGQRWKEAKSSNTIEAYENFIVEYPQDAYTDSARRNIMELHYLETVESNTIEAYEDFIEKYPSSEFIGEANTTYENLLWNDASDKKTIESYEKFLTIFQKNSTLESRIPVELSPGWFSEIPACTDGLNKLDKDVEPELTFTIESFSAKGPQRTRKIASGSYVFLPDPEAGPTNVSGTVQTRAGTLKKDSYLKEWTFVYSDVNQSVLHGWALGLVSGEVILHTDVLEDGPSDKYLENYFEINEYCNGYFLIKLDPEKGHKVYLDYPSYSMPFFSINYPGTRIKIGKRLFSREPEGWYFSLIED